MGSRGPKSSAELAIIGPNGVMTSRRSAVPPDLPDDQAEVWRGIVDAHPADWFNPGSAPVLAAFCRHVVAGRRVAAWLARLEAAAEGGPDEERWFRLLARQEAESKVIAGLATRLRLTPQSRYTPHGAASAGRRPGADQRRPWEVD